MHEFIYILLLVIVVIGVLFLAKLAQYVFLSIKLGALEDKYKFVERYDEGQEQSYKLALINKEIKSIEEKLKLR